jgi:hypothetical protein
MFGYDYLTVSSLNADFHQRNNVRPFPDEAQIIELREIEHASHAGKQCEVSRFVDVPAPTKVIGRGPVVWIKTLPGYGRR